jgi:hypothetical protein
MISTLILRKVYHVRAVTHTDVVRAGTKDISKIFQILYDVNAVNGAGNYQYMNALTGSDSISSGKAKSGIANMTSLFPSNLEHSPSSSASNTLQHLHPNHANSNNSLSTTTLHGNAANDNFSDSAIGSTFRAVNGNVLDEHSLRINSDAISVGSNDSADVLILKHKRNILYSVGNSHFLIF